MNSENGSYYQQYGVNEAGQRIIPASQRADGSWRKEIRVRSGYVPMEEVARYSSRATLKTNNQLTPGMEFVDEASEEKVGQQSATSQGKKSRRRKKNKDKQTDKEDGIVRALQAAGLLDNSSDKQNGDDEMNSFSKLEGKDENSKKEKINESVEHTRVVLSAMGLLDIKSPKKTENDQDIIINDGQGTSSGEENVDLLKKQVRNLKKKVRQCESLIARSEEHTSNSSHEFVSRMPSSA
eukprot:TRINITY_DN1511_c0_g1_i4.p1 TRINITY_DN1511_c0_g1~~TRINITY_DN1511_c0_g1_i4.p1  ORF type:complete len:238 (-),score=46.19 TRINITY_DN1511_c0_g1_i4:55-768(-)